MLIIIILNYIYIIIFYINQVLRVFIFNYAKKLFSAYEELIQCGNGDLFGPGNAKLPLPPMLMFDRITKINKKRW